MIPQYNGATYKGEKIARFLIGHRATQPLFKSSYFKKNAGNNVFIFFALNIFRKPCTSLLFTLFHHSRCLPFNLIDDAFSSLIIKPKVRANHGPISSIPCRQWNHQLNLLSLKGVCGINAASVTTYPKPNATCFP